VITDFPAFARADKSETATACLYRSAAAVVRVAGVLGLPENRWRRSRDIAEGALDAWRREFVRPDGTLAVQTQASHVRALAFGLVPDQLTAAVSERLAELVRLAGGHLATGFLSTGHLLPVLADHGHLRTAYQLLLQDTPPSWLTMVDRGATTAAPLDRARAARLRRHQFHDRGQSGTNIAHFWPCNGQAGWGTGGGRGSGGGQAGGGGRCGRTTGS